MIWAKKKIKEILKNLGYEFLPMPLYGKYHKKFRYFERLYDSINNIEGSIVECGVGYGKSLLTLASLAREEDKGRMIWGFDSFEGFPEPSVHDKSIRDPQKGEWNVSTVDSIKDFLINQGKMEPEFIKNNVKLVKGFFSDSLKKYNGGSIAFLNLDVDLYDSYKVCLEELWPRVAKGGVVAFDEYKGKKALKKFPGAAKAIDEYFKETKNLIRVDKTVDGFYIYKI